MSDEAGDTQDDSTNEISMAVYDDDSIDEIEEDENKDVKYDKSDVTQVVGTGKTKKLMNQFNFCERGTITYENSLKVRILHEYILELGIRIQNYEGVIVML